MGRVIAAYRNHPFHERPLPQEIVAGWVGITQAQLSRIESGPSIKDLDKLTEWARALHIPASLLWFKLPEHRVARAADAPVATPALAMRLAHGVYWLNRNEIDVMAGRCYTELGRPRRAEPLLRNVLDRYDEDRVREKVLYTSWLAESYVQTEDIDQAAAEATRALILSTRVNSSRSRERVQFLRRRLAGTPHARSVREFEELYRELEVS